MRDAIADAVASFLLLLFASWYVMLGVGIIHAELLPAVIPAGYWTCAVLTALFRGAALVTGPRS